MTSKTLMTVLASATITLAAMPAFADNHSGKGGKERPSFEQLDTNSDGKVTAAELQAAGAARFAKMDTNSDGSLSAEELTANAKNPESRKAKRQVKRMLRRMDDNDNGTIELSEIQSNDREARLIKRLDKDGDGAISAEEFEAHKGKGKGKRKGKKEKSENTASE